MEYKIEVSVPQQEGKAKEEMTGQRLHKMMWDVGVWLPLSLNVGLLWRSVL